MPAVRLLHTSDWHLGALFHDHPRDDEEQRALDGIVALARDQQVDAVVIAGDIFDSVNPPAAAQDRWFRTLGRLIHEAGVGCVLAIGGNHDHGVRLDAPRDFLGPARIHLRGHLPRERDPAEVVVPVISRSGSTVAWAALVPYLREGDISSVGLADSLEDQARRQAAAQAERFATIRAALGTAAAGLPMIAVAHAFAAGGAVGGSERPVLGQVLGPAIVGRLSQTNLAPLAVGCVYLALGHLHRPQPVAGQEHWRYCGSLMPMAMDETAFPRQVVIADVPADGGPATIRELALPGGRSYARLRGDLATVQTAIRHLAPPAPGDLEPWCELTVGGTSMDPGLVRDLEDQVAGRGWRALAVRLDMSSQTMGAVWGDPGAELAKVTPDEVFSAVATAQGCAVDQELQDDFTRLLADVQTAER